MGEQRLLQKLAHRHAGIQGGIGVLKDQLHVPPLEAHFLLVQGAQVLALEENAALLGLDQTENGAARGGLAATGFTHQTEGLLLPDGEGDILHRVDITHHLMGDAAPDGEIGFEVLDLQ